MYKRPLIALLLSLTAALASCGGSDSPAPAPDAGAPAVSAVPEPLPPTLKELPAQSATGTVTALGNTLTIRSAVALWMSGTSTLQVELYGVPLSAEQQQRMREGMSLRGELQKAHPEDAVWTTLVPYASVMIRFPEGGLALAPEDIIDTRVALYNFKAGDAPASNVFYIEKDAGFPTAFVAGGREHGSSIHLAGRVVDSENRAVALDIDVGTAIVETR